MMTDSWGYRGREGDCSIAGIEVFAFGRARGQLKCKIESKI